MGTLRGIAPDLLGAADVIASRGGELGRPVHVVAHTSSTNDLAKQAARAGAPHGSTWVTEEQSEGRGRQGRRWKATPGEGLLFSVLLRPHCDVRRLPPVSVVAGLAMAEAIRLYVPEARPLVKWPNDVLIRDRKVAGVLVETAGSATGAPAVVVGIGVNVYAREFPPDLASTATSIVLEGGRVPSRADLLADLLERLDQDIPIAIERGLGLLAARLAACDGLRGCPVRSAQGEDGIAEGIDESGRLLVRRADRSLARWSAGEVHLLRRIAAKG